MKIDFDDVLCVACNKVCDADLFRCFACDFNIHSGCMSLPSTVDYYDHIHPLTLISSYGEDDYCFICEEKRDLDYGVYHCAECKLPAHTECALPEVCLPVNSFVQHHIFLYHIASTSSFFLPFFLRFKILSLFSNYFWYYLGDK